MRGSVESARNLLDDTLKRLSAEEILGDRRFISCQSLRHSRDEGSQVRRSGRRSDPRDSSDPRYENVTDGDGVSDLGSARVLLGRQTQSTRSDAGSALPTFDDALVLRRQRTSDAELYQLSSPATNAANETFLGLVVMKCIYVFC